MAGAQLRFPLFSKARKPPKILRGGDADNPLKRYEKPIQTYRIGTKGCLVCADNVCAQQLRMRVPFLRSYKTGTPFQTLTSSAFPRFSDLKVYTATRKPGRETGSCFRFPCTWRRSCVTGNRCTASVKAARGKCVPRHREGHKRRRLSRLEGDGRRPPVRKRLSSRCSARYAEEEAAAAAVEE